MERGGGGCEAPPAFLPLCSWPEAAAAARGCAAELTLLPPRRLAPSGSTDEEKERAVFRTAFGEYYDRNYHETEFKELVSYMTRLEYVEGHVLNCGISDLRAFFGFCKGTQSALLGPPA